MNASLDLLPLLTLAAEEGGGTGGLGNLLAPIGIVFAIFYFLVIRPQGKERRAREQRIRSVGKHAKVVTNAGIHGVVVGADEDTVLLRVDDKNNVRIRFARSAIWQVQDAGEGPLPPAEETPAAST